MVFDAKDFASLWFGIIDFNKAVRRKYNLQDEFYSIDEFEPKTAP